MDRVRMRFLMTIASIGLGSLSARAENVPPAMIADPAWAMPDARSSDGAFEPGAIVVASNPASADAFTAAPGLARPLHAAALNNLAPWAEALIERGTDVDARDTDGRTPLM